MKKLILAMAAVLTTATRVSAQEFPVRPEIRPFMGVYLPTGDHRDLFDDAAMFGLQAALELRPSFHLLGTFGWIPGQAKYAVVNNDVQIFQYDVGLELNLVRELGEAWLFKPFLGFGGGARTYVYDDDNLKNRTCTSGYGALGTELQLGRAAIRLEGRDNVFCFRSALPGIKSKTRNDVGLSLGLAYHFR